MSPLKPFGESDNPVGFYQLLIAHMRALQVQNFAPCTVSRRGVYVRAFANWCSERDLLSPQQINKPILEAFQRYLFRYRKPDGKPLAWSSQHLHLKEVKQFFAWLARQNVIPFNPAAEIQLPKLPRQLPKAVLSTEEVERVLAQPDTRTIIGLRDRAIFEVLYSTGIRRTEACTLQLDHIQVERRVLYIFRGKGQKDRYVPIGLRALTWIARYVADARSQLAGDSDSNAVFLGCRGRPLSPDALTDYGRRYLRAAGITKPGACHIFRHSMATAMHDQGADIRTLQAILGHEKLDTTQIYTRVGLKKLIDTHSRTHPAEKPAEAPPVDNDET